MPQRRDAWAMRCCRSGTTANRGAAFSARRAAKARRQPPSLSLSELASRGVFSACDKRLTKRYFYAYPPPPSTWRRRPTPARPTPTRGCRHLATRRRRGRPRRRSAPRASAPPSTRSPGSPGAHEGGHTRVVKVGVVEARGRETQRRRAVLQRESERWALLACVRKRWLRSRASIAASSARVSCGASAAVSARLARTRSA